MIHRGGTGLQGRKYFGLLIKHYIFGLLTWLIYRELDVLLGLPTIEPSTTKLWAMGFGALKFALIVGIFGVLMLAAKLLQRSRKNQ